MMIVGAFFLNKKSPPGGGFFIMLKYCSKNRDGHI